MFRPISHMLCAAFAFFLVSAGTAPTASAPAAPRTLATKTLDNGATLLVKASDTLNLALLQAEARPYVLLTLEMQRPGSPPVQVASRLIPIWGEGEFQVFADEIAVADSEIVVPVFPGGMAVGVWRVRPGAGDDWTTVRSMTWAGSAIAHTLAPGDLTFKFTRMPNQRWAADVSIQKGALNASGKGTAHFEQDPASWNLVQTPVHAPNAPVSMTLESPPLGGRGGNMRPTVIYTRPVRDGRELVVIGDPAFSAVQLAGLAGEENVDPAEQKRVVRIEILPKPGNGEPIVLATRMLNVPAMPGLYKFAVLDSLVEPGQLIFAIMQDTEVAVWRLDMKTLKLDVATLNNGDWIRTQTGWCGPRRSWRARPMENCK